MFQISTVNITFEGFGLFFCLICICISALSPNNTGRHAESANDIQNLFICDAFVLFADAMAGIFRGKDGTLAFIIVHVCNYMLFLFNYMLFGLMINLITHMIPSEQDKKFRHAAWGITGANTLLLIWNLFSKKIYYINDYNIYVRGEWFPLSQASGLLCVLIGIFYLIRYRKQAAVRKILLFSVFAGLCTIALLIEMFVYGIAWLNIAVLSGLIIIFIYNQMFIAESLAEKRKIIAEQNLMLEQSRTQLMLSQIKPHFLFNTLTSIAQLCDDSPELAKETTLAFAKYLRKNMHSIEEQHPIPFSEELDHVKCYLQIEKVRFDDYLNIVYDISVKDFFIPCLTIQPLIENAVKHGIGQKEEGGTVWLKTKETEDAYVITVQDDGVGFDTSESYQRQSMGLQNIKTRLKQICNAEFHIESEIGAGTVAVITIPKKEKPRE